MPRTTAALCRTYSQTLADPRRAVCHIVADRRDRGFSLPDRDTHYVAATNMTFKLGQSYRLLDSQDKTSQARTGLVGCGILVLSCSVAHSSRGHHHIPASLFPYHRPTATATYRDRLPGEQLVCARSNYAVSAQTLRLLCQRNQIIMRPPIPTPHAPCSDRP